MGLISFFVYPIRSVLRNRLRSIYAFVGIMLAISFFSGSFIAVDSSSFGLMRAAIENIPVDFIGERSGYYYANESRMNLTIENIENVNGVEEAEPMVACDQLTIQNTSISGQFYSYGSLIFLPNEVNRTLKAYKINGSMPALGSVAISKSTAMSLGIEIGDNILISSTKYEYVEINSTYVYHYLNFTFPVSEIWTQDLDVEYYPNPPIYLNGKAEIASAKILGNDVNFRPYYNNPVILNMNDMDSILIQIVNFTDYPSISAIFNVWVDRPAVIQLGNPQGTIDALQFIQARLQRETGTSFSSPLADPLSNLFRDLEGKKVTFFALSLPIMVLGTYLSIVGVDLGTRNRRREIGILKARGAKNGQIYASMMFESLILGAFAGIAGLLFGIFVSRFLLGVSISAQGMTPDTEWTDISIGASTIIVTIIIGIFLMILSSHRPLKRAVKIDVADALHYYLPGESKKEYNPKWDILSLALVGISIITILFINPQTALQNVNSFIIQIILMALFFVGIAMLPLMPLLLSVSLVRILTRGPGKIYTKLSRIVRPWTKELHYIVEKNVERNPKRAANMSMVIALALAFGLFISITMESELAYQIEEVKRMVGSDIKVDAYARTSSSNASKLDSFGSIEHVKSYTKSFSFSESEPGGPYGWTYSQVQIIDVDSFKEVVNPADFYFEGSNSGKLMELKENGSALVEKNYADSNFIVMGDTITFSPSYYPDSNSTPVQFDLELKVIGFVTALPGSYSNIWINRSTLGFLTDNQITLISGFLTITINIDAEDGADQDDIAKEAVAIFENAGFTTTWTLIMDDMIEQLKQSASFGSYANFFNSEYILSVITMSIGVAIIIFITVTDRHQELACIMARGSSGSQMRKMLMGESISLMTLGLIIGISVGILTAYLFNLLSATLSNSAGHQLILTSVSYLMIAISIVSLLLASLFATSRAGKIKLTEILRIRGG